jgi:hypothetical protein
MLSVVREKFGPDHISFSDAIDGADLPPYRLRAQRMLAFLWRLVNGVHLRAGSGFRNRFEYPL